MRKILLALSLAIAAPLPGQIAEYQFTNFQTLTSGFSATLSFRNAQLPTDAQAFGITSFGVTVSQRTKDYCASFLASHCEMVRSDPGTHVVGAVQHATFIRNGVTWSGGGVFAVPVECSEKIPILPGAFIGCNYVADNPNGLLGCALPGGGPGLDVRNYTARTCIAEGFEGWISLRVVLSWFDLGPNLGTPVAPPPPPAFDLTDFSVGFGTKMLGVTVTPEPGTWALLLVGLGCLGVVRRQTKNKDFLRAAGTSVL